MNYLNIHSNRNLILRIIVCYILVVAGVVTRPLMYVALLVTVGIVILTREEWELTTILVALVHVSPIFKLSPGSTSLFTYVELIAIAKYLTFDHKLSWKFFSAWGLYSVYLLVGCGMNTLSGFGFEVTDLIKAIMVPLLLYCMAKDLDYNRFHFLSIVYVVGVLFASLLSWMSDYIPNMLSYISYKQVYLGYSSSGFIARTRFSGLMGDPNYYSIHLILSIAICAIWWSRKEIKSIAFYLVFGILATLGAMTGSKSFFLMLIVVTVMIIIVLFKSRNYPQAFLFVAVLAAAVVLLLAGYVNIFDTVLSRFQLVETAGKDLTTGRADLWNQYLSNFIEHPLVAVFGNGLGKGYSFERAPHNTFIDFIDFVGIIGSLLFVLSIKSVATVQWAGKSMGRRSILLVVILCVMYFSLSMFTSNDLPFQILLAFGFLLIGNEFVYNESEKDETV